MNEVPISFCSLASLFCVSTLLSEQKSIQSGLKARVSRHWFSSQCIFFVETDCSFQVSRKTHFSEVVLDVLDGQRGAYNFRWTGNAPRVPSLSFVPGSNTALDSVT